MYLPIERDNKMGVNRKMFEAVQINLSHQLTYSLTHLQHLDYSLLNS